MKEKGCCTTCQDHPKVLTRVVSWQDGEPLILLDQAFALKSSVKESLETAIYQGVKNGVQFIQRNH